MNTNGIIVEEVWAKGCIKMGEFEASDLFEVMEFGHGNSMLEIHKDVLIVGKDVTIEQIKHKLDEGYKIRKVVKEDNIRVWGSLKTVDELFETNPKQDKYLDIIILNLVEGK